MKKEEKEGLEGVSPVSFVPSVPFVSPEPFGGEKTLGDIRDKSSRRDKGQYSLGIEIDKDQLTNINKKDQKKNQKYSLSTDKNFLQGKSEKEHYAILLYDHPEGLTHHAAGTLLEIPADTIKRYLYRLNEKQGQEWTQPVGSSSPQAHTLTGLGRAAIEKLYFEYQRTIAEQQRQTVLLQEATIKYELVLDLPAQIEHFKDFFRVHPSYYEQLTAHVRDGHFWLDVDFNDLALFSPELAELLLERPEEVIKAWQIAIEKLDVPTTDQAIMPRVQLRISKLPETVRLSSLGPQHIKHLVQVEAQVLTISERRPVATASRYECPSCGNILHILQMEQKIKVPTACTCGRKGKFRLLNNELVAACTLLLVQPLTELVGKKVRPSQLKVVLKNDLTRDELRDHLGLNSMVRITGILQEIPIILATGGQSTRFDLILDGVSVHLLDHYNPQLTLSPERIQQITADVAHEHFEERMLTSMFPRHIGDESIKAQLLCMSVALPLHLNSDVARRQAECEAFNMIIAGDPGMGKSNLTRRMLEFCPHGGRATGAGASKAGLTIAADAKDKEHDLVIPNPGAIPNANMGIFVLDELDKMELAEQTVLNEALSEHTVTITKRGVNTTLPANICFIGLANPRLKHWDLSNNQIQNEVNIHYTLLDRGIVNIQTDRPDTERDTIIARTILNKDQTIIKPFDDEYIQDYIMYARGTIHPKLREQDKATLETTYAEIRQQTPNKFLGPRFVEKLRSLTILHAKTHLRQETTPRDVTFARTILRNVLTATGFESAALNVTEETIPDPAGNPSQNSPQHCAIRSLQDFLLFLKTRPQCAATFEELLEVCDVKLNAKNTERWLSKTLQELAHTAHVIELPAGTWRLLQ